MLIRRGLILNDLSNRERLGAMPNLQKSVDIEQPDIEKPDIRKLERNLRKIDGVSRKDAKELCNKVSDNWPNIVRERDAERKEAMTEYNQPWRDTKAKLNTYTTECDARENRLFDERNMSMKMRHPLS